MAIIQDDDQEDIELIDNINNKKRDAFAEILFAKKNPKLTSFIAQHGASIQAKLAPLQTEDDSRQLAKDQDKDIKAVYGPNVSSQFRDPYDSTDKILFHETWREDGIVSAGIDYLVQFILGDHFKTIIDVNEEFDNEETQKQALSAFNDSEKIRGYKKIIDKVNKKCELTNVLQGLLTQSFVFGRACFLKELDPDTQLPIKLKLLPSMDLGRVFVHSKSWDMLGLEYLDFPFPKSLLKSEEIFYLPIHDYHISPGSYHYGYSLLERIIHLSALNRITNQRNLKEINFRAWAGFLILELVGIMNVDTMRKLKDQIANGAGNTIMTNQNVKITPSKFETDIKGMIEERDSNNKEMLRQLQVPEFLFDPNVMNRATSQEIMQSWTESTLKAYRTWIIDVIEKQWINPMLKTILENDTKPEVFGEPIPAEQKISNDNQLKSDKKQQDPNKDQTSGQKPPSLPTSTAKDAPQKNAAPGTQTGAISTLRQHQDPSQLVLSHMAEMAGVQLPDGGNTPPPEMNFDKLINNIPRDPKTGEILIDEMAWKIKIEFEPKNMDTDTEKATSAVNLFNAGIITKIKALKMLEFDDEIQAAMLEEINNLQESQLRQATMEQNLNSGQGAQIDANGNLVDTNNPAGPQGPSGTALQNGTRIGKGGSSSNTSQTKDQPVKLGKGGGFRSGSDLAQRLAAAKKRRAQLQQNAAAADMYQDQQTAVFDAIIGAAKEIVKNG